MLVLGLAGCSTIFGLDTPVRRDAAAGDSSSADAAGDAGADGPQRLCPATYDVMVGSSHYRFVDLHAKWPAAAAACASDLPAQGGPPYTHLVVLGDDTERTALLPERTPGNLYWIGLTDRVVTGSWRWVTAEPTLYPSLQSPPWSSGRPSGLAGQDCVVLNYTSGPPDDGTLFDDVCTQVSTAQNFYICECDAYADDPARY
jgi:hypothetical protein